MASTINAVPFLDSVASVLGQAWARLGQRQFEPLARWKLMHIDGDGQFQSETVDVLETMPLERLVLVCRSPQDEPLVIQLGRIIEAIDVPSGRKVILDRWIAYVSGGDEAAPHRPHGQGRSSVSH
ncbi:MAG: hypothetical protein WAQ08_02125 [Aquabacterium sp.]|jgi:hypothetical protein|uniref:hypothetical protein n=1 Tax=Aquabacterium sp. TaxID=1872578 RepID=UPI003BB078A9